MNNIEYSIITPDDTENIQLISDWYLKEAPFTGRKKYRCNEKRIINFLFCNLIKTCILISDKALFQNPKADEDQV